MARAEDTSLLEVLAIPAMVGVGALVAVQSEINGRLATELGGGARGGAAAAVISFGLGLLLLVGIVLVLPRQRAAVTRTLDAVRAGRLPARQLLGGVAGASLVASQGLTVGTIGVALFTVAMVAGQTSSGLLVDRAGLGPSGPQAVTPGRVVGAALTLGAVALAVAGRLGGADALSAGVVALCLLPLLAGAGTSWQQAVNGRVSAVGGPLAAALNNFVVGLVALLAFLVVALLVAPGDLQGWPGTWWLYVGGPVGVLFITLTARLVSVHGVLVLGLCTVAGLVLGSLLIDALGPDSRLGPLTVVGALLTLVGVAVVAVTAARASRARRDATAARAPVVT